MARSKINSFPSEILILNQKWTIKFVDVVDKNEPLMGCCDFNNREIRIDKTLVDEAKKETLIHEMCHAYIHHLGGIPLELEEHLVQIFSVIFMDIVRANKPFWS